MNDQEKRGERQREILAEAERVQKAARDAGRSLRSDEVTKLEGFVREFDELANDQTLSQKIAACDAWSHTVRPEDRTGTPPAPWEQSGTATRELGIHDAGFERRKFDAMFPGVQRGTDGFRGMHEFMQALHGGCTDPRLHACATRAMSEGIGSAGGFAVPIEYARTIFDTALESEVVRPRARVYPMTSSSLKVPGVSIGSHATAVYGGLTAGWTGEAVSIDDSDIEFRTVDLSAKKLAIYTITSNELLSDGITFDETVTRLVASGTAHYLDSAFIHGTGAGQPLGAINAPCCVTVDGELGQGVDTVIHANIVKMISRLWPGSWSNSVWMAHPTVVPELLELCVSVGAGGSVVPATISADGTMRLYSRPVIVTEKMNPLGDSGDIMLADWTQYGIGLRSAIVVDRSPYVRFQTDETCYRAIVRADGAPLWSEALTLRDGATTVSPFVVLAAR